MNGTSAAWNKGLQVHVCMNNESNCVGGLFCVCVSVLYTQHRLCVCVCVCVCVCERWREQSRTTGLRLCCYSSNELPGASAFLMKSSLWSLLYLIPIGQVPRSLLPISWAAAAGCMQRNFNSLLAGLTAAPAPQMHFYANKPHRLVRPAHNTAWLKQDQRSLPRRRRLPPAVVPRVCKVRSRGDVD